MRRIVVSRTSYLRRPLAALLLMAAVLAGLLMAVVVLASTDGAGLTIEGGSADITISGDNQYQVFLVESGAKLTLSNLTVADGAAASRGRGGGIHNSGTLEVSNSTLSDNRANGAGGGIYNLAGAVTVRNSTLSGNSANGSESGGGIFNFQGTLEVSDSTLSGNSASSGGGASGGGIYNAGPATVRNSTLSGNSASLFGGGITNRGMLEVSNSTLSDNSAPNGGGIENGGGATATLKNTIVANSPSASGGSCYRYGIITDGGYNLDSDNTCFFGTNNFSLSGVDPMLGPLADNGGPTKTHALLAGSPAIDKGNSFGATTDQRGAARPQGTASDIGSFESESTTTVDTIKPTVSAATPTGTGVARGTNLTATFSEKMDPLSITKSTFKLFKVKPDGSTTQITNVSVKLSTDGLTAKLNPFGTSSTLLAANTKYKGVITTGAKDVAGNRLDQDSSTTGLQQKVWYFTVDN
jgi:hypothetical protein